MDEIVKKLHKTYFRFEYDKAERPSKEDDKAIIAKMISAEGKAVKKDEEFKIIMDIFNKSNAQVYDIEDGMRILQDAI